MAMTFSFDDEQRALQGAAQTLLSERSPLNRVREIETESLGYDSDLWREMADRGWLGMTIPSAYGGAQRTYLDLYPLYEELGRFLVPSPHLDTAVLAPDVLLDVGSDDQRQRMLPEIASGNRIVSVALLEGNGAFGPRHVQMQATRNGTGFVLTGTKVLVAHASSASSLLCAARTEPSTVDGVTMFLVDADSSGITRSPIENIAGGALDAVAFEDVSVPAEGILGPVNRGWATLTPALLRAAVLQTASIVGAARAVLAMTNQYAKDREQFGRPIGSYQAVQYLISDILIDLHGIDLLAKQAAYRISSGRPFVRESAMAVIAGKRAAAHLHRQAHEVFAGIGFMTDHDLNLFSRRSKYWENNLGDVRYYYQELAREMGTLK